MSLLVRVAEKDGKLVFGSVDPGDWVIQDNPEYPQKIMQLEGARDYERGSVIWNLEIHELSRSIYCGLNQGIAVVEGTMHSFEYRPGTLVLEDVREMENPLAAKVKTFRTVEFQEFMDRFGIQVVHNCTMRYFFRGAAYQGFYQDAYTTSVVHSGKMKVIYDEKGTVKKFISKQNVTWALETIVLKGGEKVRVLHTNIESLDGLIKSLRQHGVRPMKR